MSEIKRTRPAAEILRQRQQIIHESIVNDVIKQANAEVDLSQFDIRQIEGYISTDLETLKNEYVQVLKVWAIKDLAYDTRLDYAKTMIILEHCISQKIINSCKS